jgi:hypothetical protein
MQLAQATIVPSTLPEFPLMLVDDGSSQGWPGREDALVYLSIGLPCQGVRHSFISRIPFLCTSL